MLLPSTAGALSACGALYSDVIAEFSRSRYAETRTLDLDAVNAVLDEIEAAADAFLDELADVGAARDAQGVRRRGPLPGAGLGARGPDPALGSRTTRTSRALEEAFHATHERVFAVREPGQYLECLLWKVRATAVLAKPAVRSRDCPPRATRSRSSSPTAYFPDLGLAPVPRYDGAALAQGARIEGPGDHPRADDDGRRLSGLVRHGHGPLGNYLLEVGDGTRATALVDEESEAA